jgi:ABC-2 type transport system permease protein
VPSNVMMISTLVKFPLIFISGIFIPLEQMPEWGRLVALFSPLTYLADLIRYSIQGANYYPIFLDISIILSFTILFLVLTIVIDKRNLHKRL